MKILVIDSFPDKFLRSLEKLSSEIRFLTGSSPDEARAALPWAEVLIINSKIKVDKTAIDSAPDLKLVCRAGVGLDHIDVDYLAEKGIQLVNTPGANARPVGEQAIGMLIGLMHRIYPANKEVGQFQWNREANRGTELGGKTVGIIGYGNTGQAFARCASGFGMRLLAYDKYRNAYGDGIVEEAGMEKIFQEADIVTFHVPLTDETHHMGSKDFFDRFAKPIRLLNLSRGPVVNTADLIAALQERKLLGAALDVLENEKMNALTEAQRKQVIALAGMDNVILTPHIGGWSFESLDRINGRILEAVGELIGK